MPSSLPFMRILTDYQKTEGRKRLLSTWLDCTILSTPRNVISSTTQNQISYATTRTSNDAPRILEHCAECEYKPKRQYQLVCEKVGYTLRDVWSIDKAFKAIKDGEFPESCHFARLCVKTLEFRFRVFVHQGHIGMYKISDRVDLSDENFYYKKWS